MTSADERLQGYIQSLAKNRIILDGNLIVETDLTTEQNVCAIRNLLGRVDPPTAVVAFNDYVAIDAIRYAKSKGYDHIYFTSYANLPITSYLDHPPVVSVEQFPQQQAERAIDILLKLVEAKDSPTEPPTKIVLDGKLVINLNK